MSTREIRYISLHGKLYRDVGFTISVWKVPYEPRHSTRGRLHSKCSVKCFHTEGFCIPAKATAEKENYNGKAILKQVVSTRREDGLGSDEGCIPMEEQRDQ